MSGLLDCELIKLRFLHAIDVNAVDSSIMGSIRQRRPDALRYTRLLDIPNGQSQKPRRGCPAI